jgi:hypothetical protein
MFDKDTLRKTGRYTYWHNTYDFSKLEAERRKEWNDYDNSISKIGRACEAILDKVVLSGLDIDVALKEFEKLEV